MNIIYLSSGCSNSKFNYLTTQKMTQKMPQAQKYHYLLMKGIIANHVDSFVAISTLPVNSTWTKQRFFKREEEIEDGITFVYPKFTNSVLLRNKTRKMNAFSEIKKYITKDSVLICDILNNSLSSVAIKCGKKYKVPVVGVVTDVPGFTSGARRKSYSFFRRLLSLLVERLNKRNMDKFDMYLFQTKDTNLVVNKKNKPFIIIEGQCDSNMSSVENTVELKEKPRVVMYAGGIHKEFGIDLFVKAFINAKIDNCVLDIYGDGNYQNELVEIAKTNKDIHYYGRVANDVVVSKQTKATLLVNPRLSSELYVRYSFPSKTLESMASGTPLLTTKLPCIPEDYFDYLYFFDNEDVESFKQILINVLSKTDLELNKKGMMAKQFVLQKKNNIYQAKRLLDFIEKNRNDNN